MLQVITPVRRSARKTTNAPALASMLRETEFAYAPNEALARPRHPFLDPHSPAETSSAAIQQGDDAASTSSSVTGVSLAGDYCIPATSPGFPGLEEEVSFATHSSSSRLSSQSPSLLPQSPLFFTTPSEQVSLHMGQQHASGPAWPVQRMEQASTTRASAVEPDEEAGVLTELTNTGESAGLVTPPAVMSKALPYGPVTRSKSARKASILGF